MWYEHVSARNWYYENGIEANKCMNCGRFAVDDDDDDDGVLLCAQCLDYINERMSEDVKRLLDRYSKRKKRASFIVDNIPDFSVISVNLKGNDIFTIGVDWDEVLITDVIVEDYDHDIFDGMKTTCEDLMRDLVSFVMDFGEAIYSDIFDKDALRSNDCDFAYAIDDVLSNGRHKKKADVIAWKAIDNNRLNEWKEIGHLPHGECFSLAEYFPIERRNSTQDDWSLLKIFVGNDDVIKRKAESVELKRDIAISKDTLEVV